MARAGLERLRAAGRDPWAHELAEDVYTVALTFKEAKERGRIVLPPEQWALIYTAAASITPTLLKKMGRDVTEENVDAVEVFLLQVWGNALLTLDGALLDRLLKDRTPDG